MKRCIKLSILLVCSSLMFEAGVYKSVLVIVQTKAKGAVQPIPLNGQFFKTVEIELAKGMRFLDSNNDINTLAFLGEDPEFHLTFFKFHE